MDITTRQGFTATGMAYARCYGANHRDRARIGICDGCGNIVAKTDTGRVLDVYISGERKSIACWSHGHECDPECAAAYVALRAIKIDAGEIIKGQTVTVVKGRKVAKGTTGVVLWTGEDAYGKTRIGFKSDDGKTHWTAASNVEVTA
jgi:hypothetical protein